MEQTDKKKLLPPTIRARQAEVEELFAFFAVLQEIEKAKVDMRARLKAVPNGWRDIRMIETVLRSLIDRLLLTLPGEKLLSIKRVLPRMSYKVYFNRAVVPTRDDSDATIISMDDLDEIVKTAHGNRCICCDDNCNQCALGKAFDHIFVKHRARNESWSYLNIAEDDSS